MTRLRDLPIRKRFTRTRWDRHSVVTDQHPVSASAPESSSATNRGEISATLEPPRAALPCPPSAVPVNYYTNSTGRSRTRVSRRRCESCATFFLPKKLVSSVAQPVSCTQCESDRVTSKRRSARLAEKNTPATVNAFPSNSSILNSRSSARLNGTADVSTTVDNIQVISQVLQNVEGSNNIGVINESASGASIRTPKSANPDCNSTAVDADQESSNKDAQESTSAISRIRKKTSSTFSSLRKKSIGDTKKTFRVKKSCSSCGTTKTPTWRRGPLGKATVCNACGTRWMRYGSTEPRLSGCQSNSRTKQESMSMNTGREREVFTSDSIEERNIPHSKRTQKGQSNGDPVFETQKQAKIDSNPLALPGKPSGVEEMNSASPDCERKNNAKGIEKTKESGGISIDSKTNTGDGAKF